MSSNSFDVVIIGAGVAGSSAASELVNAGMKVLVLEKEKLPRYKTCGGGVVLRSANLLPLQINPVVQREFKSAEVNDHENKLKFQIERNEPLIFMVMRSEFDYFLLNTAIERGAIVNDQSEVKEIIQNNNFIEVLTGTQNFSSKFVIACDGATGFSMTKFRLNQNILRVPAVESELFVDNRTFDRLCNVVRFDFGFVPHGYGWVFPKGDHLSVGTAFMKRVNQSIHDWFEKYLWLLEINPENVLKSEKHGYVIPLIQGKLNCCNGRILFAGDNLGFTDPLTAEGISYAVETGQLAARAVIKDFPDHFKAASDYRATVDKIHIEIKSAKLLSKVVYGPLALRKFIFRHWGNKLSELLTDVITGEKEYSKLVKNPMNYLKLFRPAYWTIRK